MQATNSLSSFEVTTDGVGVVGHAGAALLRELADRGDCLSDLATLRDQPELFGPGASTPTAWRVLDRVARDADGLAWLRAARAHARLHAWAADSHPDVELLVIDADATLVLAHSDHKEGAAGTYKHTFGFAPLLPYLDRGRAPGEPLAGILRPGNRNAQRPRRSRRSGRTASATSWRWQRGPQTIGYSLLDSPVGLAAWLLDHDTDSYYKISRAFVDGEPVGSLTRDSIVDNITLYWLTGTAASAARSYWEDGRALAAALASGQPPPAVRVPVGFTTFPGEIWASPRSWVEAVYPDLAYFNEVDRGGHFAAWEEPQLFSEEVRAAFRSLR